MSWATERARLLSGAAAPTARSCLIAGCPTPAADIAYCPAHRAQADDGSLWLRCVFCPAPVAPNDPLACSTHRAALDATPEALPCTT